MRRVRNSVKWTCFYALVVLCFFGTAIQRQAAMAQGPPVKVFILSGQSNMVGAGKVDGGSQRWGTEFLDPSFSFYEGNYDPDLDCDQLEPKTTKSWKNLAAPSQRPIPAAASRAPDGLR